MRICSVNRITPSFAKLLRGLKLPCARTGGARGAHEPVRLLVVHHVATIRRGPMASTPQVPIPLTASLPPTRLLPPRLCLQRAVCSSILGSDHGRMPGVLKSENAPKS